jgi:hypothetical protein
MRKFYWLALTMVFVLAFGGMAMAQYAGVFDNPFSWDDTDTWNDYYGNYDAHVGDDGLVFYHDVDAVNPGNYTNLEDLNRNYTPDTANSAKQKAEITINAKAYIPCFLEMKLTGNQGTTGVISYGSGAEGSTTASGYELVFDNEIGGYLDENWNSLGHGTNVEINPGTGVYIGACDIFAVEVMSNDDYRYEVEAAALTQGFNLLPMHMRSSVDSGSSWLAGYDTFGAAAPNTEVIYNGSAGNKLEALHNFRVPYNMSTAQGQYNGQITFRAVTI